MPVIKSPVPQPKNETIQLRVPQGIKFRLERYAEFITATPSYVVVETLERLFRKDTEFQTYLAKYKPHEQREIAEATQVFSAKDRAEAL
jgi:hypothetical protein